MTIQVIASALMLATQKGLSRDELVRFSGTGLRDMTRLAAEDGTACTDTALLSSMQSGLTEFIDAIDSGDRDRLMNLFEEGRTAAEIIS